MKHFIMTATAGILLAGAAFADGHRSPAPEGARAYIVSPADGSTVSNPVTIVFGLEGMGVAPAGTEKGKHRPPSPTDQHRPEHAGPGFWTARNRPNCSFRWRPDTSDERAACGHAHAATTAWRLESRAA